MCVPPAELAVASLRLAASSVALLPLHLSFPNVGILPHFECKANVSASEDKSLDVELWATGEEHSDGTSKA